MSSVLSAVTSPIAEIRLTGMARDSAQRSRGQRKHRVEVLSSFTQMHRTDFAAITVDPETATRNFLRDVFFSLA